VPDVAIVDWDVSMSEKDGYPHYMLKEINEQGAVFRSTLKGRNHRGAYRFSNDLDWDASKINSWKNVHIVACGRPTTLPLWPKGHWNNGRTVISLWTSPRNIFIAG
jgi:glucosamine 6-phosphate synthetase-like amidotransferase/phosphosugar isomerase protein